MTHSGQWLLFFSVKWTLLGSFMLDLLFRFCTDSHEVKYEFMVYTAECKQIVFSLFTSTELKIMHNGLFFVYVIEAGDRVRHSCFCF